jgi:hypothetical protein
MTGNFDWAQLTYLLMALLLVSGAGYGFARLRHSPRLIMISIVFWAALIALIVVVYNTFN